MRNAIIVVATLREYKSERERKSECESERGSEKAMNARKRERVAERE